MNKAFFHNLSSSAPLPSVPPELLPPAPPPPTPARRPERASQQLVRVHDPDLDRAGVVLEHHRRPVLPSRGVQNHVRVAAGAADELLARPRSAATTRLSRPFETSMGGRRTHAPSSVDTRSVMLTRPAGAWVFGSHDASLVNSKAFCAGHAAIPPLQPGSVSAGTGANPDQCKPSSSL